ncbi:MAG: DUF374 domain-containing protein [Candidatus Cloacimonetes bacterium]|nr:DUF374 domain-containing protein [Candidatus Cloacimonadota bacterium]MCF7813391.1 DUF374 domain-containing protein [Candidatus Cloacimonadota bacterium]MCF7867484.1 DUF374 domain-containing protein [Candidatus Cloacimonadota bacterium]MCF7883013.1 DUF374 domain-containing protein [Candidatus Cloacimonadota bacterium]
MSRILFFLEKYLAAWFVLILGKTLRFNLRNQPPKGNVIYAFWHRNMIPLLYLHRKQGNVILISSSKDGELIAGPAHVLGYNTARGSSRRGGSSAVKKMIKMSKKFSLAVTPDGPKGPNQKIKDGLLYISYFTRNPIVPVALDLQKEKVFNSWDKFRLPHLFSHVNITYGKPLQIMEKSEIDTRLAEVQDAMDKLEKENKINTL